MSIRKSFAALYGAVCICTAAIAVPAPAIAQTATAEGNQAVLRLSVVFLEQVVGAWSVVLPKWDRDPTGEDWQAALQRCATRIDASAPKVIGDASPQLPQPELLVGSLVYYRGPDGLQQLSATEGDIRKFPKLQIGKSNNNTPVYQITGSGGARTISIGKIPSDEREFIVMINESALLLRCQPNASE
ncbi:MAG: hypothetical protein ABJH63_04870 [Rhizobiaceae bacterium]